ncbi:MAG: MMPL family transporter [Kineosporiaceae bacterium]
MTSRTITDPSLHGDEPARPGPPAGRDRSPNARARRARDGLVGWCARHRWRTLAAALLVLAGAVVLLGGGITTTSAADQLVGDSRQAQRVLDGADFGTGPTENVVVSGPAGRLAGAAGRDLAVQLRAAYTGVQGVARVGDAVIAADGATLVLPVELAARSAQGPDAEQGSPRADLPSASDAVAPMLDVTHRLAASHPDLTIGQVGDGSVDAEVGESMERDLRRAEVSSLPVTLAILLIAFGAVVAAGVPVVLGIAAVATALGLTALTSRTLTPVDQNSQSMVVLIGLAVGVDYALFLMRRAREERAAGRSVRESIVVAGRTAGRAVIVSGITVVVAMSGMLVAGGMFTSLAIGAMLVVAVAVLASATVLPALLSVLGDKVDALRMPWRSRSLRRHGGAGEAGLREGFWARLAGRVTRRPLVSAALAGGMLLALAAPALGMRTSLPGAESLPDSFSTLQAYQRMSAAFPQKGSTVDVVVRAPRSAGARVDAALTAAFARAEGTGVVGERGELRHSLPSTSGDVVTVMALPVPFETSDPRTDTAVDGVRDRVVPAVTSALGGVDGVSVHVGGTAAVTDLTRWLDDRLPWVIGFVLVLTFVVMLLSFGSPVLAAATVGLNMLSVGAAYGLLVLVFQHTWAEGLLGFTSIGSIAAWLPLLMFVILFGLSMDYHVFVVSRVREAYASGMTPREAVRRGVGRSAGVVTSAAAVMVAVFAIFATMSSLEMKQLGVGLSTAVLLDATVVRGVLLPAVLALLGRRAHTGPRWIPVLHH